MTETVTLAAPAKLTLSLRVTGVRDDGLHLIDAEMVTLDLADTLVLDAGYGSPAAYSAARTRDCVVRVGAGCGYREAVVMDLQGGTAWR